MRNPSVSSVLSPRSASPKSRGGMITLMSLVQHTQSGQQSLDTDLPIKSHRHLNTPRARQFPLLFPTPPLSCNVLLCDIETFKRVCMLPPLVVIGRSTPLYSHICCDSAGLPSRLSQNSYRQGCHTFAPSRRTFFYISLTPFPAES